MSNEAADYWTLPDCQPNGMFFVDMSAVNLNDMLTSRPGVIVRCKHLPAVQYIPTSTEGFDHIAGLISDAA